MEKNIIITKLKRKISGGDLPDGYETKMDVTIDFSDATREQLAEWAFRSVWIACQGQLRKKTTSELNQLSESGYQEKATAIMSNSGGTSVNLPAALKALGYDEETIQLILENKEKAMEIFGQISGN